MIGDIVGKQQLRDPQMQHRLQYPRALRNAPGERRTKNDCDMPVTPQRQRHQPVASARSRLSANRSAPNGTKGAPASTSLTIGGLAGA